MEGGEWWRGDSGGGGRVVEGEECMVEIMF